MTHRRRPGRALTAVLGVALALAAASCGAPHRADDRPDLSGERLEVVASWTDTEQSRFLDVLRAFTARTGAVVAYTPARDSVAQVVDARLAAGRPPDVALLPQPGLLRRYAAAGRLVPLDSETEQLVRRDYAAVWRALASDGGRLYGVWFKAANKSLLWYDVGAFERAGIAPPEDLDRLLAAARAIRAAGLAPFSVGGADRWTLTDWFENLYLQLAGAASYDRLAAHELPWTDPSVLAALDLMRQLLAPRNLRGGVAGTDRMTFEDSVAKAFTSPPTAAMVVEGDFVASVVTARTHARIGVDVDAQPFPTARRGVPAMVGGGDVAVQLRRSRAGAELMRYLASPEAAAVWARAGGFVSANQELDLATYPDALSRSIARSVVEAGDGFRFDLSDQQPSAFGSTGDGGMQLALHDFLRTGDVPGTARRLEQMATAAYAGRTR